MTSRLRLLASALALSLVASGGAAAETVTLVHGNGLNRWNAAGFRGKRTSKAFGTMSLTYKHASKTLKGGGSNPACSSGLSWTLDGKFAGKKFTAKVTITLPDNQGSAV